MDLLNLIKENCLHKNIWGIKGNVQSSGSIFSFEVGEKLNTFLNWENILKPEGECSFMVHSSWRLSKDNSLITTWKERILFDNETLLLLDNLKITNIFISQMFDLSFHFEKNYVLDIFCDDKLKSKFQSNWDFRLGKNYFFVNMNNDVIIEKVKE